MCLWNMDAPGGNKVKIQCMAKSFKSPGACDVSEMWGTHRWTYSPSLVTISAPKFKILHFVCKRDGITDRKTDRQRNGQTDDPITRCPRWTFQGGGIKLWYPWKGLVTRNAHVKYGSSIIYSCSWVISKVKMFVHTDADAGAARIRVRH